jgi:hypothetical protein
VSLSSYIPRFLPSLCLGICAIFHPSQLYTPSLSCSMIPFPTSIVSRHKSACEVSWSYAPWRIVWLRETTSRVNTQALHLSSIFDSLYRTHRLFDYRMFVVFLGLSHRNQSVCEVPPSTKRHVMLSSNDLCAAGAINCMKERI